MVEKCKTVCHQHMVEHLVFSFNVVKQKTSIMGNIVVILYG